MKAYYTVRRSRVKSPTRAVFTGVWGVGCGVWGVGCGVWVMGLKTALEPIMGVHRLLIGLDLAIAVPLSPATILDQDLGQGR